MKQINLLLAAVCLTFVSFGQQLFELSPPFGCTVYGDMFYYNGNLLTIESQPLSENVSIAEMACDNGFRLEKCTSKLQDADYYNRILMKQTGENVYSIGYGKKMGPSEMYRTTYSIKDGSAVKDAKEVYDLKDIKYTSMDLTATRILSTGFSRDSSVVLLVGEKKTEGSKGHDVMDYILMDGKLTVLRSFSLEKPFLGSEMQNVDYCVNAEGTVFNLIVHQQGGLKLIVIKDDAQTVYDVPWSFENKIPNSATLVENANGGVQLTGLYRNTNHGSSWSDGVFIMTIDDEGEVHGMNACEFPNELINPLEPNTDRDLNIEMLTIENAVVHDDNSTTVFCQIAYSAENVHFFKDLYICHINESGELVWMNRIAKNQGRKYYKYFFSEGFLDLYYLDNPSNFEKEKGKSRDRYKFNTETADLICFSADLATGETKIRKILNTDEVGDKGVKSVNISNMVKIDNSHYAVGAVLDRKNNVIITVKTK